MSSQVIRASYDTNEQLQAITLNNTQEYTATATRTQIIIYQLLPQIQPIQQFHLFTESGNNFKMTDVAWNLLDSDKIAASATNGSVVVFNLNMKTNKQPKQEWDCGSELTRAVNCISWNPSDRYQLLSAYQDGNVKLWDIRQKNVCLKVLNGPNDSCRDAKFDPFHSHILASIYESGSLMVWDRRNTDHPIYRFSAHSESGLVVEWNPNKPWIIATGSRDKSVKIWDISGVDDSSDGNNNNNTTSSTPTSITTTTANPITSANLSRPLHVIHTPAALGSISWRPAELESSRRCSQLATSPSSESGRGDISVWDVSMPNIPACILRGHTDGCSGFQWLDTPPLHSDVYQHIISVGKDNKILVQDLRNSYFPSQHMSRHVIAVSAIGHVAFQRGNVDRSDPLGLVWNELTSHAPSYFKDDPSLFGIRLEYFTSENQLAISALENPTQLSASSPPTLQSQFDSGGIYVGMGTISKIVESIEWQTGYSAEGGAYDPIVVKELALQYKYYQSEKAKPSQTHPQIFVGSDHHHHHLHQHHHNSHHSEHPIWGYESFFPSMDSNYDHVRGLTELFPLANQVSISVREAMNACEWNSRIAQNVGLAGHSKIWTALMSLIPAVAITFDPDPLKSSGTSSSLPLSSCSFSYAVDTLCDLLIELIDCGDCQHFVICCEVLRHVDNSHFLDSTCSTSSASSSQLPSSLPALQSTQSVSSQSSQSQSSSQPQPPPQQSSNSSHGALWKNLLGIIGEMRVREGYVAYLELLSRLGLHQIANSIIVQSTDKYIAQLSQQGVIMRSSCAQCGKELNVDNISSSTSLIASIWCVKCQRCVDLCSLCQQPVKGLLNWCQVCGHGGHPNCIKKWYEKYEMCPSGCGHKCVSHEQMKHQ